MSIIYDALKKVEISQANDPKTKIKKIAHQDEGSKSKPKIYLLYALMICLGLFIANIFYGRLSQKEPYLAPTRPTAALEKTPSIETEMENQKETPYPLILNGVFFSGGEGYALINNRIVKKGDKIEGATVAQISLDEVELERDGSMINLSNSAR